MSKKYFIRFFALALVLILVLPIFTACSNSKEIDDSGIPNIEPTEDDLRVVLTIDGFDITYDVYRYFFMQYKNEYDAGDDTVWSDPEIGEKLQEAHRETVLTTLKRLVAIQKLAKKADLSVNASVIEDLVDDEVRTLYESADSNLSKYKKMLEDGYLTHHAYRYITAVEMLESRTYMLSEQYNIVDSSNESALAAIRGDEFVCVKHVLIKMDEGDSKEENLKKAEEILALAQSGTDFDSLIDKYSEDRDIRNLNDGYYITHYQFVEEFEDAAFALEEGEISGIVNTDVGYSIIKKYPKDDSYINAHFSDFKSYYLLSQFHRAVENTTNELPDPVYGDVYSLISVFNQK